MKKQREGQANKIGYDAIVDGTAGGIVQGLKALPRHGRMRPRIVVASDAVYSQTVSLPQAQTEKLSRDELLSALFYEIEPFCGFSRQEALVGFDRLPDGRWRVAAAQKKLIEEFALTAASERCVLVGVAPATTTGGGDSPTIVPACHGGTRLVTKSLVATAVLAAICAIDWSILAYVENKLSPVASASEEAAALNGALQAEINAETARIERLAAERKRHEEALQRLAVTRTLWPGLLDAVKEASSTHPFVLRSITPRLADDANTAAAVKAEISAVAPTHEDAMSAMVAFSAALDGRGWKLEPGASEKPAGSAMTRFSVVVVQDPDNWRPKSDATDR